MVEQYIYSRSDKSFVNSVGQKIGLGHGFMAWTDGVTAELQKALLLYCAAFNNKATLLPTGEKAPVYIKAALATGDTVLQSNAWIQENRGFHVAHGYVLSADSDEQYRPEHWFRLPFQTSDANVHTESGGLILPRSEALPGVPVTLKPLADTVQQFGLEKESFKKILRACLDAIRLRRQVQIACDFTLPDVREWQQQLLCWIYRCLPWALRRALGFDMTYTSATAPRQYQITFVWDKLIQVMGRSVNIKAEKPVPLGNHYLFAGSEVYHGRGGEARYDMNTLFVRWLDRLVDVLWDSGAECAGVLEQLEAVYGCFHGSVQALELSAEQSIEPELYDALCWNNLTRAEQPHLECVADALECADEDAYIAKRYLLGLPSIGSDSDALAISALEDVWGRSLRQTDPHALELLKMVGGREGAVKAWANAMAAALLTRALRMNKEDIPGQLTAFAAGLEREQYKYALQAAFFVGSRSAEDLQCWNEMMLSGEKGELDAVCAAWAQTWLQSAADPVHLLDLVAQGASRLDGISPEQAQQITLVLQEKAKEWVAAAKRPVTLAELGRAARFCVSTDARMVSIGNAMLDVLCASCMNGIGAVGLPQLEELQKALQPSAAGDGVRRIWREMFAELYRRAEQAALFPLCPQLLHRIRALLNAVSCGEPEWSAGYARELFAGALVTCTRNVRPYMTADWLQEQLELLAACGQTSLLINIWTVAVNFLQKLPELQTDKRGADLFNAEFLPQWNALNELMAAAGLIGDSRMPLYHMLSGLYMQGVLPRSAGIISLYASRCVAPSLAEEIRIPVKDVLYKLLAEEDTSRLDSMLALCCNVEQNDLPMDAQTFRYEILKAVTGDEALLDALHKGRSLEEAAGVRIMRSVAEMAMNANDLPEGPLLSVALAQELNGDVLRYLREKGGMLHKPMLGMYERKYLSVLTETPEPVEKPRTLWRKAEKAPEAAPQTDGWDIPAAQPAEMYPLEERGRTAAQEDPYEKPAGWERPAAAPGTGDSPYEQPQGWGEISWEPQKKVEKKPLLKNLLEKF